MGLGTELGEGVGSLAADVAVPVLERLDPLLDCFALVFRPFLFVRLRGLRRQRVYSGRSAVAGDVGVCRRVGERPIGVVIGRDIGRRRGVQREEIGVKERIKARAEAKTTPERVDEGMNERSKMSLRWCGAAQENPNGNDDEEMFARNNL